MNELKRVSIIIPVYNVKEYIADCLYSVFNQTYKHIEIIVVNDCTPDSSMQIAMNELQSDKNKFEYTLVNHEINQGLSAARNSGVKAATGDYIYFLDSDDEITSDCIELLVNKVTKYPDVDFVIGEIKISGAEWHYPLSAPAYSSSGLDIVTDYFYERWYVMAVNKLLRKSFFISSNLWFKEGRLHEDELFSFYLAIKAQSMACVNSETYIYKVRISNSITSGTSLKNFVQQLQNNTEIYTSLLDSRDTIPEYLIIHYITISTYKYVISLSHNQTLSVLQKKEYLNKHLVLYIRILKSLHIGQVFGKLTAITICRLCFLLLPYPLIQLFLSIHKIGIHRWFR